jgi:hypothetical protein
MMAQHRRHAAPLGQRLNLGRCHRVDLLTAPVQKVPVKRHPHGAGHTHHRSADDGSRNAQERGRERASHGGHHTGRDLDRTNVYPPLAAHHPSPHNMHLRWRTPPGNQQGQFRGYAGRPFGSPVLGYPGTVPDPERAGQRPRSSAGLASVIGPPGEPGRRRASGPRSRPRPAAAHAITRRNAPTAVDLNGRTEQRIQPARCPIDHGRDIRLTPHSRDPADTRNQASDFGHLHRGHHIRAVPRSGAARAGWRGSRCLTRTCTHTNSNYRLPMGFPAGTMGGCAGSCRHDVPSCRQNRGAAAPTLCRHAGRIGERRLPHSPFLWV